MKDSTECGDDMRSPMVDYYEVAEMHFGRVGVV